MLASRTPPLERKRSHEDVDEGQEDPGISVSTSTSRKKTKPVAGQTGSSADNGTPPTPVWNQGVRAKIRVTLGGPRLGGSQKPAARPSQESSLSSAQAVASSVDGAHPTAQGSSLALHQADEVTEPNGKADSLDRRGAPDRGIYNGRLDAHDDLNAPTVASSEAHSVTSRTKDKHSQDSRLLGDAVMTHSGAVLAVGDSTDSAASGSDLISAKQYRLPISNPNIPSSVCTPNGVDPRPASSVGSIDSDGVMINLENADGGELESGEVSEHVGTYTESEAADEDDVAGGSDSEDDGEADSDMESEDEESDKEAENETDAMMDYASSDPPARQRTDDGDAEQLVQNSSLPKTLADISPKELRAQVRYFYVARDPRDISINDPVRCLVCMAPGHMAATCPLLTCQHCGEYKTHFARKCPTMRKCERCHEAGHQVPACPYKVKRPPGELKCKLCGCTGHPEDGCEVHWRSSRFPPLTALPPLSVRLSCYECGGAGHLGNDCRSRNPRKPLGTSMWSVQTVAGNPVPTSKPVPKPASNGQPKTGGRGMSIKGHAERNQKQKMPVGLLSEAEDDEFFRGPRISAPARVGTIRVEANVGHLRGGPHAAPTNAPEGYFNGRRDAYGGGYGKPTPPNGYGDGGYAYERDTRGEYRGSYNPRDGARRRSRSPPRNEARQPETYRPMPSAAASAWKRGRT